MTIPFNERKIKNSEDLIQFLHLPSSKKASRMNFYGLSDVNTVSGTDVYVSISYNQGFQITDTLVQTILQSDIHEINTNNEDLKECLCVNGFDVAAGKNGGRSKLFRKKFYQKEPHG